MGSPREIPHPLLPQALQLAQFSGMSNPAVREWRFNSTLAANVGGGWRLGFSTRFRDKAVERAIPQGLGNRSGAIKRFHQPRSLDHFGRLRPRG